MLLSFLRMTPGERRGVLEATTAITMVWAGLRLRGLARVQALISRPGLRHSSDGHADAREIKQISRAIRRVSRRSRYFDNCLVRALAGKWLMHRKGLPVELRIGVHKNGAEGVRAHAWLESEGRIVLGAIPDQLDYLPLRSWSELSNDLVFDH